MAAQELTLDLDRQLLRDIDFHVAAGEYASRDQAIRAALNRFFLLGGQRDSRQLLRELNKLDKIEERDLAEAGIPC